MNELKVRLQNELLSYMSIINMEQPRLNLAEHGKPIMCEKCGCDTFQDIVFLFRISKIVTGSAQDTIVPMPSFKCSSCGNINEEFKPRKKEDQNSITT